MAGAVIAAGLLLTSAVTYSFLQSMGSMVVYAGANDFSWSIYAKKDALWWNSSEVTALADEIIQYQLSDGGWPQVFNDIYHI